MPTQQVFTTTTNMNILDLPVECLLHVFGTFDRLQELLHCLHTCRRFRQVICHSDNQLFKPLALKQCLGLALEMGFPNAFDVGPWFDVCLGYMVKCRGLQMGYEPSDVETVDPVPINEPLNGEIAFVTDRNTRVLNHGDPKCSGFYVVLGDTLMFVDPSNGRYLVSDMDHESIFEEVDSDDRWTTLRTAFPHESQPQTQALLQSQPPSQSSQSLSRQLPLQSQSQPPSQSHPRMYTYRDHDEMSLTSYSFDSEGRMVFVSMSSSSPHISIGRSRPGDRKSNVGVDFVWTTEDIMKESLVLFSKNLVAVCDANGNIYLFDTSQSQMDLLVSRKLDAAGSGDTNLALSDTHMFCLTVDNALLSVPIQRIINTPPEYILGWDVVTRLDGSVNWRVSQTTVTPRFVATLGDLYQRHMLYIHDTHTLAPPKLYSSVIEGLWLVSTAGRVVLWTQTYLNRLKEDYELAHKDPQGYAAIEPV